MTACKCGLSNIYPVCDYEHNKIIRNEILRKKIIDLVNEYEKNNLSE